MSDKIYSLDCDDDDDDMSEVRIQTNDTESHFIIQNVDTVHSPYYMSFKISREKLKSYKIPFFSACTHFKEGSTGVITVSPPNVPLHCKNVWETWFHHMQNDELYTVDHNNILYVHNLYTYIYSNDNTQKHMKSLLNYTNELLFQKNITEFTLNGVEQLIAVNEMLEILPEDNHKPNSSDKSSRLSICFSAPRDEKMYDYYIQLGKRLQSMKYYNYASLFEKSIMDLPENISKHSVFKIPEMNSVYLFRQKMMNISNGLWHHVEPFINSSLFWSGGSLVWALMCEPIQSSTCQSRNPTRPLDMDIDLFCTSPSSALALFQHLEETYNRVYYVASTSVLNIYVDDIRISVQVIFHSDLLNPWQIIHNFDMDYVKVYYDGKQFLCTSDACYALETRTVRKAHPMIKHVRLQKAVEKGFLLDQSIQTLLGTSDQNKHILSKSRYDYYYPSSSEDLEYNCNALQKFNPFKYIKKTYKDLQQFCEFSRMDDSKRRNFYDPNPRNVYYNNILTSDEIYKHFDKLSLPSASNTERRYPNFYMIKLSHTIRFVIKFAHVSSDSCDENFVIFVDSKNEFLNDLRQLERVVENLCRTYELMTTANRDLYFQSKINSRNEDYCYLSMKVNNTTKFVPDTILPEYIGKICHVEAECSKIYFIPLTRRCGLSLIAKKIVVSTNEEQPFIKPQCKMGIIYETELK